MSEMLYVEHKVFTGNISATCIRVVDEIYVAGNSLTSTVPWRRKIYMIIR